VIPHYAKSAATLFALGAETIVLGELAELGPLDAQIVHSDQERMGSALEVLQSVERLNSEALQALDAQVFHLLPRSRKRISDLLPITMKFVSDLMRPLWERIDTVQFTQVARVLKVGQDYAERLLASRYGEKQAVDIATALTKRYPDHGFVIDSEEAERIGLEVEVAPDFGLFSPLSILPRDGTIVGVIREVENVAAKKAKSREPRPGASQERRQRRARNRASKARPKEIVGEPSKDGSQVPKGVP
jgi:hypothetical protein